ncbi:ATP-binding cassette domain-containing protein [Nakamurella flavida]|uniref:ATP-binding cassette domain-containing protein n=1 Tax=Nakamurella flavida TaxID=363630 RepID=A0A939C039_9ACTN|nr:ATP-binding cassette domain-containing protein [Nakamurella flavida]MBM9476323.1 ATP-binding cassette domain-containing protein [Nakamurella flavida]MDP9779576.1 ABC-type bacteriocin/lantibiotic exporter with double-glycine peptidase domain [Nakamurella flavida]
MTTVDTLPSAPTATTLTRFALRGSAGAATGSLLAGLVSTAAGLAVPLLGLAAATDAGGHRTRWVVLAVLAVVLSAAAGLAADAMSWRMQNRAYRRVESAVWRALLALPASFFARHPLRVVVGHASSVSMVRTLLGAAGIDTALAAISATACSAVLFLLDWRIALAGLGAALAVLAVVTELSRRQQRHDRTVFESVDDVQAVLYPALVGIDEVQAYGAQELIHRRFSAAFARQRTADDAGLRHAEAAEALLAATPGILFAVLLPTAAAVSPDVVTLALITVVTVQFAGALARLAGAVPALFGIALARHRLEPVLSAEPEVPAHAASVPGLSGGWEFRDADFGYPDAAAPVLRGLTLRVRPGEFLAVVGASGSGKSTLLRAVLGLVPATAGTVLVDGADLRGLDIDDIRRRIGYVPQDARLPRGTVRSAILQADPAGDDLLDGPGPDPQADARALAAVEKAGLAEDLAALPMGLDTRVSDGDNGLSGGQNQRLLLARALARDPAVLLLDEATSALDDATQDQVARAVTGLGLTRIVVAHRLSTIRGADRVVVLAGGRIVQVGRPGDLLDAPGEFARLFGAGSPP